MQRILIADSDGAFMDCLKKQLENDFCVMLCRNAFDLPKIAEEFRPDIIFADMDLSDCDMMAFVHCVLMSGSSEHVIVRSANTGAVARNILYGIGVTHMFPKPCAAGSVVGIIRQLAMQLPEDFARSVEAQLDNILLYLGFQCGRSRYNCLTKAILLKYYGKDGDSVKYLYSEVRKLCGKNTRSCIEKAIRDAIGHAWSCGDHRLWRLYFPVCDNEGCPSNEVFIGRIALALHNAEKPYKPFTRDPEDFAQAE